ncbi:MAG: glycosyltransferase family 4 protein [Gemmatimonadetes bacterium]|nr:glycosyltransferase family 4 protein [Gemmatimonadota bacterium]
MKIAMLTDTFLPSYGGAEIHVLELSRALHDRGHSVRIVTATAGPADCDRFVVDRVPRLAGGGAVALAGVPGALRRLHEAIRAADVVHCHYSFLLGALGAGISAVLRRPAVTTLHGLGTLDSSVGRSVLRRSYRRTSLALSRRIIATSDEMRAVASRFAPESRIRVIPNGVAGDRFVPAAEDEQPGRVVILSMRRLAPKNGVQYLIEAAPAVLRAVPTAEFWIAGSEKLEGYLRERVRELGIEASVRFLGTVPYERADEFYRQAGVVVFPSSAESTSLACLEAMACGKAVIASALGPYKALLGADERGLLVRLFDRETSDYNAPLQLPPDRIAALAAAIVRCGRDAGLRRELGHRAREHVLGRYTWDAIARDVESVYEEALRAMSDPRG